jgi:hypothetical protein
MKDVLVDSGFILDVFENDPGCEADTNLFPDS